MAKYGLLIGNDFLDTAHYGSDYKLNAPSNDVKKMEHICDMEGIYCEPPLINHGVDSVISNIKSLSEKCSAGDFVLIYFSGHGTQFPGKGTNEEDGLNESWCLYDRCLTDNEINNLLSEFSTGVWVLIISDSCHSGSVAKIKPSWDDNVKVKSVSGVYNKNKDLYEIIFSKHTEIDDINPSVILLSACQDNEEAKESSGFSEFTSALVDVWDHGNFIGGYDKFISEIDGKVKGTTPNISHYPHLDIRFSSSKPFKI